MAKKKGFMSRLIEGPERSENYARSTLPSNRWQLGWDIFKTNFTKLVLINLLLALFCIPLFLIWILHTGNTSMLAQQVPFGSFMSYPFIGSMNGMQEYVEVQANIQSLIFLPIAAIILSVGLSGVLYILRNMVWTEGVFVGSDFWRGIKKNFGIVCLTLFVYSIFLVLGVISYGLSGYLSATGDANAVLMTITRVVTVIALALMTMMCFHMLTMSVTYELGFFKLVRNAFILTISLLPTNIFFLAFALVGVLFTMIMPTLGIMALVIIGLSGGLLVWTVYSHWIYDKFINENVPGAKRNRGIYSKPGSTSFGDDLQDYGEATFDTVYLNKRPIKPITDYDVEIMELPESFGREDLKKLEESKAEMRRDSDKYVEDVLSGKIKQHSDLEAFKNTDGNGGEEADKTTEGTEPGDGEETADGNNGENKNKK